MAGLVFAVFAVFLMLGMPIVSSIAISSITPTLLGAQGATSAQALIRATFGGADTISILAVPLFILAGVLMARGGISKKLFDVFAYFIGNLTAGMPCAAMVASAAPSTPRCRPATSSRSSPMLSTQERIR